MRKKETPNWLPPRKAPEKRIFDIQDTPPNKNEIAIADLDNGTITLSPGEYKIEYSTVDFKLKRITAI